MCTYVCIHMCIHVCMCRHADVNNNNNVTCLFVSVSTNDSGNIKLPHPPSVWILLYFADSVLCLFSLYNHQFYGIYLICIIISFCRVPCHLSHACQNCSQWPPAGKAGRGCLLNCPSSPPPPNDPTGQATPLRGFSLSPILIIGEFRT